MQCTFIGCGAEGDPQNGFDFYVCADCLEELEHQCVIEHFAQTAKN